MNEKSISINHKTSESLIRIQLTIWITYLKNLKFYREETLVS